MTNTEPVNYKGLINNDIQLEFIANSHEMHQEKLKKYIIFLLIF